MKLKDMDFWTTATHARDDLEEQLSDHDDVRFVDIGYPQGNDAADAEISLRIHVSDESSDDISRSFPTDIAGLPVVVSK